jgi:hypothetical protein
MTITERVKKYPEETALIFLLLIGAVLRFYHLGFTSLSNDELSALIRTRFSGFSELIEKGVAVDGHPAFIQVLLFYWIKTFGDDVFIIRVPFAIAGILSVLFIFLLGKKWFGKTTGLFAAAATSTLQFPLLYSQLARPYVFSMLFTLMAAYFWTIVLFESTENRKKRIVQLAAFILSMSACMYTHYFSFVEAILIGIAGLFFLNRENRKEYVASGIIIVLLFLPHLSLFFRQLDIGGVGLWLGKPDESFFRNFIDYCFNDSYIVYYLCIGICVAGFVYFRKRITLSKYHWLSLLWFILLFFIGYYYSIFRNPVLQSSTLLPGFPFLLLFIFSFIPTEAFNRKISFTALLAFTIITGFSTVKEKHYFWTNHYGVFKEIAADAMKWSDKYGEHKMAKVISVANPKYIDYYFDKAGRKMKMDLYSTYEESDLGKLQNLVDTTSATYFLYGWTNVWHPYEAARIIMNKFPLIAEKDTFFNSEIILYKRDTTVVTTKIQLPDATDFEDNHWGDELKLRTDELAHSGKYSQKLDDKTEYSISFTKPLSSLQPPENKLVTAIAWVNAKEKDNNAKLVLSFESGGKAFEWYSASVASFNLKPGEWQKVTISRPVPKMKGNDDVMKVYIWNEGKKTFYVDDFEVRVEKTDR